MNISSTFPARRFAPLPLSSAARTARSLQAIVASSLLAASILSPLWANDDKSAEAKASGIPAETSALAKPHDKRVWSFDYRKTQSRNVMEVVVDVKTGRVVSTQIKTPEQEAASRNAGP